MKLLVVFIIGVGAGAVGSCLALFVVGILADRAILRRGPKE